MADVTYDSFTVASNSPVATLSIDKPTNAAQGDLLVIVGGRSSPSGADSIVDDNGANAFTKDFNVYGSNSGWDLSIFTRRVGASDPSTYNFDFSGDQGATTFSLVCMLFKNPHPTTLLEVAPSASTDWQESNDTDGDVSYETITTGVDKCIHLIIAGKEGGGGVTGFPAGYTSVVNQGATHLALTIGYKVITPAGATGILTGTETVGGNPITVSMAIKNDPTGIDPNAYTVKRKIVYATR